MNARFGLLLILIALQGCQEKSEKTDSMLFRETAINSAQQPLRKAQALLTQDIRNHPLSNLDTLLIVRNSLNEGANIYKEHNITSYTDSGMHSIEAYFNQIEPILVEHAKKLLLQVIDKTVLLRKQIEEAKTLPYSARNTDTSKMVDYLGDAYNKDIKLCCLQSLSLIDQLLAHKVKDHRELLILIRSLNSELVKVIQKPNYYLKLKKQVDQL